MRMCKQCGVPSLVGKGQTWHDNGVITETKDPEHRMFLCESDYLEDLFQGIRRHHRDAHREVRNRDQAPPHQGISREDDPGPRTQVHLHLQAGPRREKVGQHRQGLWLRGRRTGGAPQGRHEAGPYGHDHREALLRPLLLRRYYRRLRGVFRARVHGRDAVHR